MATDLDQAILEKLHAWLKEREATHVSIPRAQHEAHLDAATTLAMLRARGHVRLGNAKFMTDRAIAVLHAAGIKVEGTKKDP